MKNKKTITILAAISAILMIISQFFAYMETQDYNQQILEFEECMKASNYHNYITAEENGWRITKDILASVYDSYNYDLNKIPKIVQDRYNYTRDMHNTALEMWEESNERYTEKCNIVFTSTGVSVWHYGVALSLIFAVLLQFYIIFKISHRMD